VPIVAFKTAWISFIACETLMVAQANEMVHSTVVVKGKLYIKFLAHLRVISHSLRCGFCRDLFASLNKYTTKR